MSKQKHKTMEQTEIQIHEQQTIQAELGLRKNKNWYDLGK